MRRSHSFKCPENTQHVKSCIEDSRICICTQRGREKVAINMQIFSLKKSEPAALLTDYTVAACG